MLENGTYITKEQAELLVRNLDHLYEACQRNRYVMPKRNSPIITIEYCHGVSIAGVMSLVSAGAVGVATADSIGIDLDIDAIIFISFLGKKEKSVDSNDW